MGLPRPNGRAASRRRRVRRPGSASTLGPVALRLPFQPPLEPMLAKAVGRAAGRRRLAVRAQVGRLPGAGLPRRRRGLHAVARPQAAGSLFPGAGGAAAGRAARPLRARRRGRHRPGRGARFRGAAAAHPPGRIARPDAGRRVAGELRGLGPPGARRRGPASRAAGRAAGAARGAPGRRPAAGPPDAGDAGIGRRQATGSGGSRAPVSMA